MVKGREILGIHKANVFLSKSSVCSITPSVLQIFSNQSFISFLYSIVPNLFRNASFIFLYFISNLQLSRSIGCYCYLNKEKRILNQI